MMKLVTSIPALLALALVTFSRATPTPQDSTPISCGVPGLSTCLYGQICVTNPAKPSCPISAECPGICAALDGPPCGGWLQLLCPDLSSQTCVDDPRDNCDPHNSTAPCQGICVHSVGSAVGPDYPQCGGFTHLQCPSPDQFCAEDPRGCKVGDVDCFGICVGPETTACGGLAGLQCPGATQICVDDPRDICDPKAGDLDCRGICV